MPVLNRQQLTALIAPLLPQHAALHAECDDSPNVAALLPEEEPETEQMVASRLREFTLGRYCAREAMGLLGQMPRPVLRCNDRAPIWPSGLVGTITHSGSYVAAAVANSNRFAGIGLDIEQSGPLEDGTAALVCRPDEQPKNLTQAKLLFVVKESIYKAIYPTVGKYVDFQEMEVQLDRKAGSFVAVPHIASFDARKLAGLQGRFVETADMVISSSWLPHPAS